jgi:septum formation protein
MSTPPSLILASTSPRRRELLGLLGLPFEVVASAYDEAALSPLDLSPQDYVMTLARGKAAEVAARCGQGKLIIGADTTVVLDGAFLNKPTDDADAARMLRLLGGRTHQVYTGLCLIYGSGVQMDYSVTDVTFDTLTEPVIAAYIATGEPRDKAGAYGIQGKALSFIPGVQGDYFNVVGLPLFLLCRMLPAFGVNLW